MGLNYYICTGENPEPYSYLGGKFPVSAIISLFTLVTYTGVSFRLALEKREIRLQEQQQVFHLQQNGFFDKLFPHVSKYAWSTLDLKNLYVSIFSSEHYTYKVYVWFPNQSCMFVIVGDSILWNKYTKELTARELQTSGMGQFCFLLHQYILGMVAVWTLVINTYLRKEELRKCKYLQMYPDL